ncbi:MAG: hypothetical protein WD080_11605 [Egibacteraceae bacterium]
MRCAECGTTNAETADWCARCFGPLRAAAPAQEPQPAPPAAPAAEPVLPAGLRRRDGDLEWECPRCGRWESVASLDCAACHVTITPQGDGGDPTAAARRLAEPWVAALALSAVVPGAGHIGLGRYGAGLTRALLFAAWVVGGAALWVARGMPAGGPFVLGAGLLWAGTLVDIGALRRGRREVLGRRSLRWLAVGVVLLTAVGVLATT